METSKVVDGKKKEGREWEEKGREGMGGKRKEKGRETRKGDEEGYDGRKPEGTKGSTKGDGGWGERRGKKGRRCTVQYCKEGAGIAELAQSNASPQGLHRLGRSEETILHKDVLQERSSTSILFLFTVILQIRPVASHRCIASFARPHKPLEQQQLLHSQLGLTRLDMTI